MIEWILVLLAIPFGLWLRDAAGDELKVGRKWFTTLVVLGLFGTIVFAVLGESAAAITSLATAIVAGISLRRV